MSEENNEKPKKRIPEDDKDFPAEEQGIIPEKTEEQVSEEMEHGEKNEDVYTEEGREKLVEDGEISPEEEGFMEGANASGQLGKDALTGESLMDVEDVIEAEIKGIMYRFVNEENAIKFRERKESEE
jgi:hypothetical protein